MSPRLLLAMMAGLSLCSLSIQAEDKKEEADNLPRWIKQLGSARFREREAATTALLKQRTPQALALLRQTAQNGDPDVRKRAREVLAVVERRLETETVLAPLKLRLDFKDVPVADAVADFARRTGLKVVLADSDKGKLANRKVTISTGEVSIWEALRQLCEKAGLNEQPPEHGSKQAMNPYENLGGGRIVWRSYRQYPLPVEERIFLADGIATRPMFQAGSLRIQAVPRPPLVGPPWRETELTLAVDVEPRFTWNRLVSIRIEEAVDDRGQKLVKPEMVVGELPQQHNLEEFAIIWDGMYEEPRQPSREGAVKLKLGQKSAKKLTELRGRLAAEIEVPPSRLIDIADILKASGKTFPGPDSSQVRVIEAKADETGQYLIKVEVILPPPPKQHLRAGNVIWLNRGPVPAGGTVNLSAAEVEQKGLRLFDAQGQPFLLATGHYDNPAKPEDPLTYTLYFQPRKEQGDPVRLELSAKRNVIVEVPFVLKDVPLP
jgi:hypothetical protein